MLASLRARLWLSYLLVVGVVVVAALFALAVYVLRNPASDRRELQRLRLVSNVILQRRRFFDNGSGVGNIPVDRLDTIAGRLDSTFDLRIAVFDAEGTLLVDSRQSTATLLPALTELRRPLAARRGIFRDSAGKQWLYVSTPLDSGQVLVVSQPRPRLPVLTILRDDFLQPVLRALFFALALSLLMAFWMARWIAAPLQRLANAVRRASVGEFEPIQPAGPREVQEVEVAFNDMAGRLEASQRAQRDLVANVSHDLKTPLTSIQGFAQALLDGTVDDPEAARASAEVIYTEAGRMHRMVLDLLDLARFDAGTLTIERRPLDLRLLVAEVVTKFAPQASQARVNLQLDAITPDGDAPLTVIGDAPLTVIGDAPLTVIGDAPLTVIGDADRLAQVFSNLIDNALKFTPSGGRVQVNARNESDWVEVRVADSGPGVPPDELERIFERFYQTDKSRRGGRRGAGLGLAIAREIVRAHSGEIHVINCSQTDSVAGIADLGAAGSRPAITDGGYKGGTGCVFVVRLPVARPDDETVTQHRKETGSLNRQAA